MEILGNFIEANNELNRPRLVDIITLATNPEIASTRNLLIFPPIRGALPTAYALEHLMPKSKAVYGIRILKYGFPDPKQYYHDVWRQLEALPNCQFKNTVFTGFSEGAGLLAKFARHYNIPKENVYLLAPITSYKPSSERYKAWQKQRGFVRQFPQSQGFGLKSYLHELLSDKDEFYSPNGDISKLTMIKILNQTRRDYTCSQKDLTQGVVVRGRRDFISPPIEGDGVTIDATHRFEDFVSFLSEVI